MWLNFEGTYKDFKNEQKNEPGVLIEVILNDKRKEFLIGDISQFNSVMNGDMLDIDSCPLIRYKFVWRRNKRGML